VGDLDLEHDATIRAEAMAYIQSLVDRDGGVVTRADLESFHSGGRRMPLLDQSRGIRNPAELPATLSILTTTGSPYDDTAGAEGLLRYAMCSGDPGSGDNRKLRRAYELGVPLIWFQQIAPGVFAAVMPVYLVAEETAERRYVVALGDYQRLAAPGLLCGAATPVERRYAERLSKQRLHQPAFRAGVMLAYQSRCTICALKHADLLDAAHIIEDGRPGGDPVVPNGLALCKIHHAAYDRSILGVSPDLTVHIDRGVLDEVDGPMLRHGLQDFHGAKLRVLPPRRKDQPDRERLAERFERFRLAG
jgi:putative restriction endonuclease